MVWEGISWRILGTPAWILCYEQMIMLHLQHKTNTESPWSLSHSPITLSLRRAIGYEYSTLCLRRELSKVQF